MIASILRLAAAIGIAKAGVAVVAQLALPSDRHPALVAAYIAALLAWSVTAALQLLGSPASAMLAAGVAALYATPTALRLVELTAAVEYFLPAAVAFLLAQTEGAWRMTSGATALLAVASACVVTHAVGVLPYSSGLMIAAVLLFPLLLLGLFRTVDARLSAFAVALTAPVGILLATEAAGAMGVLPPSILWVAGAGANVVAAAGAIHFARITRREQENDVKAREAVGTKEHVLKWALDTYKEQAVRGGYALSSAAEARFLELFRDGAERAARAPRTFLKERPLVVKVIKRQAIAARWCADFQNRTVLLPDDIDEGVRAVDAVKIKSYLCPDLSNARAHSNGVARVLPLHRAS